MAKFIKSIFSTGERRKSRYEDGKDDDNAPHMDLRRKLSISRSGRMKQANKKRQSLCLDLYGKKIQSCEKKSTESLNTSQNRKEHNIDNDRRRSTDLTPEEEIDSAFEIIHKT
ncbi:unnamed protein product [Leptidea sinapis]|uniref:Uncharacterized protein n=1 Tax=Leptidea sinapis TaxID=189913 RepID=A0A5E4PS24_9NEOP|nr:unnamed protein product [Leptidea sinapis]